MHSFWEPESLFFPAALYQQLAQQTIAQFLCKICVKQGCWQCSHTFHLMFIENVLGAPCHSLLCTKKDQTPHSGFPHAGGTCAEPRCMELGLSFPWDFILASAAESLHRTLPHLKACPMQSATRQGEVSQPPKSKWSQWSAFLCPSSVGADFIEYFRKSSLAWIQSTLAV